MTTPPWLLTQQAYAPRVDRDAFIDRSIRSLLHVMSRISSRSGTPGKRSAVDARVKLVSLLMLVLLVSLSRAGFFVLLAAVVILILLAFQSAEVILDVLKVSAPAAGFAFVILLPSALWGNGPGVVRITLKVLVCVSAARLLSATTPWGAMTRAMAGLRMPDLFVLVLDITVLYVWLLGCVSLEMLHALKARSVGRNREKTAALSGVAGTLFLKSRSMTESLYAAMECRCFRGTYRCGRSRALRPVDYVLCAGNVLLVAAFIFTRA